jgi:tetratricopeptide (TPR) repeat protein
MKKSEALILLVNSMSRSEKKVFRVSSQKKTTLADYMVLFNLIENEKVVDARNLKELFLKVRQGSSFEVTAKYLYNLLLDKMLALREQQDSYFSLFNNIMKARILFEKSLFEEAFDLLELTIKDAEKHENYYALMLASKLELEYYLNLDFPGVSEKDLLNKHFKINEILKFFRKVNELSSLYELLKFRMTYKGLVRSQKQKLELNDLVVSEMSIIATSSIENFEIKKLHQLFQANYLISVGDYKSALRSYRELNSLFEVNSHLWSNPPIYYLLTLQGVLESLRKIRNYDGMKIFVERLKKLNSKSVNFNVNIHCLIFLNELFPKLDQGDFKGSFELMQEYQESLYNRSNLLGLSLHAELSLYSALIMLGMKDFKSAYKYIGMILLKGKNYQSLPLYRTIRLVNLMILYELKSFDLILNETRSIRRELKGADHSFRIERFMFKFLNRTDIPLIQKQRDKIWEKSAPIIEGIRNDIFEQQLLKIFDFTAWIESHIRKLPLSDILASRNS